jgi:adenylate cyclase
MERKLTAILSADVKGYSRLMGEDDEATVRTLTAHRETMTRLIQQHHGRVVDSPGDNLSAEFASVVDAVRCAMEIQRELKTRNAALPSERKMEFRIGINLGDVIVEGERIYGDGVNIAARLEGLAEPGGICISGTVHEHVKNKLALSYEYRGEQAVKNITDPVRVYRLVLEVPSPLVAQASSLHAARMAAPPEGQGEGATGSAKVVTTPHPGLPPQGGKEPKEKRRMSAAHLSRTAVVAAGLLIVGGLVALLYPSFLPFIIHHSSFITPKAQPPALPLPDKPSIVVLPFVNMSEDPKQEYFSDGITENLTTDLSQLSGFFVISRNSAFTYKGKAVNVKEVSRELGVRHVVEGSVQKAGDRVRINAQLVDTMTGHHVWTERYDRELKDIFTLQDEVIQKIVFALKVKLTPEEQERFRRTPTDNLEAYDFFLRGVGSFYRSTTEANAQARQLFEKAIALDPQYAGAYAWLGWTYWMEWVFHSSQDPQRDLERAFELAQRARALDDSVLMPTSY